MPAPVRTMAEGAKALVERSRAGDQNAMATIASVRTRALFGRDRIPAADRLVAMTSYNLIKDYVASNPVGQMGTETEKLPVDPHILRYVHADTPEWMPICVPECMGKKRGFQALVVRLANGRPLTAEDLDRIAHVMGGQWQGHVLAGALRQERPAAPSPQLEGGARLAFMIGVAFGTAMTLQAVRERRAPIRLLSPEAAWELGEAA
jgi:hypothetical protein